MKVPKFDVILHAPSTRSILGFHGWVAFSAVFLASLCVQAQPTSPDTVALIRGVVAARENIRSGRMEMTLVESNPKQPKGNTGPVRLNASFDGFNRRMDQYQRSLFIEGGNPTLAEVNQKKLQAMNGDRDAFVAAGLGRWENTHVRSAFDGAQLLQYAEALGAYVKDPSKGTGDYVFDPRILGISIWYTIDMTVANYLIEDQAKSVSLVGHEMINGHQTSHVRLVDKYDQDKNIWIDSEDGFKVYKSELNGPYKKRVVTCSYGTDRKFDLLPDQIEMRERDQFGDTSRVVTITVDKAEYNVPVDPKAWTLAGMGMPLGEMVIDQRIHRVVGHFDGKGLTQNMPEAIRKGKAARWAPLQWGMALSGLIALTVLGAWLFRRKNLLREGVA